MPQPFVEPCLIRGSAGSLPLPDESVDLIVTSPPYFGLRAYTDGGVAYDGQIGAEATPGEFIAALVECTREWVRVLKPSGSLFVNLGDKYANPSIPGNRTSLPQGGRPGQQPSEGHRSAKQARRVKVPMGDARPKSLMLLPERYRIACVDELGLIARAVLVWSKPNGLPESVTDRVRRSHEDWVHLTRSPKYFAAVDEIREPHIRQPDSRSRGWEDRKAAGEAMRRGEQTENIRGVRPAPSPLGKLPGSVWEIATQPLRVPAELGVQHFAAFPMEIPRRLILGWSPREVCTACGEGRRPVSERTLTHSRGGRASQRVSSAVDGGPPGSLGWERTVTITGYACACPDTTAPSTPGVVLDPFGGTGTTALVAAMHGRQGISVDLSADYCRLAGWRVNDPKQRERASRPAAAKAPRRVAPRVAAEGPPTVVPLFDVG